MLEQVIYNKAGWTRVALDDVAENINDYFDRENDDATRYIAGEHVDENELRVDRWGRTDDGFFPPTFKRLFKAGDILFHSRNIKKVASPNFDGVTGEKLFVLRSKDENALSQEFLGYVLSGTHFSQYAEQNWSGSVNKFFNWKPLKRYEFLLPPIQEQARLCELFSAGRRQTYALQELMERQSTVLQSAILDQLEKSDAKSVRIGDVAHRVTNGFVGSAAKHYVEDGIPYLRSLNVRRSGLQLDDLVYISDEFHQKTKKSQLVAGDMLTVQSGHVGETAIVTKDCEGWNCHALILTRLMLDKVYPDYCALYLNSSLGQRELQRFFIGSTVAHLNTSDLAKFRIPLPALDEQKRIADLGSAMLASLRRTEARIHAAKNLYQRLLESTLSVEVTS